MPYTTRPRRSGEIDGREYHFVTESQMKTLYSQGKIVERRKYNTIHGKWYYFTADDCEDIRSKTKKYITIGTLEAFTQLRDYYGTNHVVPIYIEVEDAERLRRSLEREKKQEKPSCDEVCRRYLADQRDFSDELLKQAGVENAFLNKNVSTCVATIIETIKNY